MDLARVEDYQNEYFGGWKSKAKHKACFCVGPEKCNDKECGLVKAYLKTLPKKRKK